MSEIYAILKPNWHKILSCLSGAYFLINFKEYFDHYDKMEIYECVKTKLNKNKNENAYHLLLSQIMR
jgi:hypothetical protein